jgi:hypothetical protein
VCVDGWLVCLVVWEGWRVGCGERVGGCILGLLCCVVGRTVLWPRRFMKFSARRETAVKTTQGIMKVPPTVSTEAPVCSGVVNGWD